MFQLWIPDFMHTRTQRSYLKKSLFITRMQEDRFEFETGAATTNGFIFQIYNRFINAILGVSLTCLKSNRGRHFYRVNTAQTELQGIIAKEQAERRRSACETASLMQHKVLQQAEKFSIVLLKV